jgi:hypothetical protein
MTRGQVNPGGQVNPLTIIEELCETYPIGARTWWIADTLHAMKCQRARLQHDLILDPEVPHANAVQLNETLGLNAALTNFQTLLKMNDVLAVEVFAIENLASLLQKGKLVDALYLLPFVCWYAAISIQGLEWDTRLGLLKMAFYVFVESYHRYHSRAKGQRRGRKFFLEIPDFMRYINTRMF